MRLSRNSQVTVRNACMTCRGEKVVKDDAGNETPCTACKGEGGTSYFVSLGELTQFVMQEGYNQNRR